VGYSANRGCNFCPLIGSTGKLFADQHLSVFCFVLFCFVLISSYVRSCLTVLCVGSFRFATQLASPAATDRLPGWGFSGCETLFRGFLRGKENCSEEAEAWGYLDSHRRYGGTCRLSLQVGGHGRNMRSSVIAHAVVWEVMMQFPSRKTLVSNLVSYFPRFVIYNYLFTCVCSLVLPRRGVMCLCGCCHSLRAVT